MTSVQSYKSQVAPFKAFIATASASLSLESGAQDTYTSYAQNTIFSDMGKTVVLADGSILRKVQVKNGSIGGEGRTGYIYLSKGSGNGLAPSYQNIACLN